LKRKLGIFEGKNDNQPIEVCKLSYDLYLFLSMKVGQENPHKCPPIQNGKNYRCALKRKTSVEIDRKIEI